MNGHRPMMKQKRILFWVLCAILVYNLYGYTKQHTTGDVLAYKRLASALVENDTNAVHRLLVEANDATQLVAAQRERTQLMGDHSVLFTYYVIKKQWYSRDGQTSYIVAEQISRVNPPGAKALIGEEEVRVKHAVELVKQGSTWYVKQFQSPVMAQSAGL